MKKFVTLFLVAVCLSQKSFSQFSIIGSQAVLVSSLEYYKVQFKEPMDPSSVFSWTVSEGTITSQNVDLNNGFIYCWVQWSSTPSGGSISIYEELSDQNAEKKISISAAVVLPAGPITYYNQYETANFVYLNCMTSAASYQWYKNDNPISGATSSYYTVNFIGLSTYTDYYYVVTPSGSSNIVTFNYRGCDDPSDYPVTIPTIICASSVPVTISAPAFPGAAYAFFNGSPSDFTLSNQTSNQIDLSFSSCTYSCVDGITTLSYIIDEEAIYMYYVIVGNQGCKTKSIVIPETNILNNKIIPNPAISTITITNSKMIEKVEIFTALGMLVKQTKINKLNNVTIDISGLKPGFYICRVITDTGTGIHKLIIQK